MNAENVKNAVIAVLVTLVSFLGVTCVELKRQIDEPKLVPFTSIIAGNRADGNLYILSAPRSKRYWDSEPIPSKVGGNG